MTLTPAVAIFVERALAKEREACAAIADKVLARELPFADDDAIAACEDIAAAIRRRGLPTHRAVEQLRSIAVGANPRAL